MIPPPIVIYLTTQEIDEARRIGRMRKDNHAPNANAAAWDDASDHILGATGEIAFEKWTNGYLLMDRTNLWGAGDKGVDFIAHNMGINVKLRRQDWHDMLVRTDDVDRADIYVAGWFDVERSAVTFWGFAKSLNIREIPPRPARNKKLNYLNHEVGRKDLSNMRMLSGFIFKKPIYLCSVCGHYAHVGYNDVWYCSSHKIRESA